jgi:uncharacterized protein
MTRIGLLSDTHSFLPNGVFSFFENCDEIWHAGDIGHIELAKKLSDFKPLKAVYGNIDGQEIRNQYPVETRFLCEETDVWMTHIGGYPGKYDPLIKSRIFNDPPKLFISGHSHILKVINDQKLHLLHMNPGAAGKNGLHHVITMLRFEINGTRIENLDLLEIEKNTKDGTFFNK